MSSGGLPIQICAVGLPQFDFDGDFSVAGGAAAAAVDSSAVAVVMLGSSVGGGVGGLTGGMTTFFAGVGAFSEGVIVGRVT